ncbi:c-type cytochrome biogenesis protein CcmI [Dechloromonas sp. XY25]|uniref:C-type cytochrome biogenesis protein CcmI n=1 Tax=Dechloromonas hankyongensis TaxID=2908002 RepID=A0ABS9JX14_9RHOO|nr:c-type cytochrome biogenesis protein CcmI [Dechloromonas hankyongensis]
MLIAFAFLLPPMWRGIPQGKASTRRKDSNLAIYRSQIAELERERAEGELSESEFLAANHELKRRLLEDVEAGDEAGHPKGAQPSRKLAALLVMVVPLLAVAGYLQLGNPRALNPLATAATEKMTPDQIEGMVAKLADRLKATPDGEGWLMLARSYKSLGRLPEAVDAYEKASELITDNPDLLTDYADLLATQNGGSLHGKPLTLVKKALTLDPDHVIALWLAGTAAFDNRDYGAAVTLWERARRALPEGSEDVQTLSDGIQEAQKRAAFKPDLANTISGQVALSPNLNEAVAPGDTLFVFARPTDGSRMPIAIAKAHVSDLPFDFVLDDSSAMMADNRLSQHRTVLVLARISKSGNAIAKPGDLESEAKTVRLGEAKLRMVIDRRIGD